MLLTAGITACMISGIHSITKSAGMHDNNMKDLFRDYVSSKITQGPCFTECPLRDYVSLNVHSGTMFHQFS